MNGNDAFRANVANALDDMALKIDDLFKRVVVINTAAILGEKYPCFEGVTDEALAAAVTTACAHTAKEITDGAQRVAGAPIDGHVRRFKELMGFVVTERLMRSLGVELPSHEIASEIIRDAG